ncbi:MAG: hypothetical protein ACJ763_11260, partial [Bdellovibrionia bacterium]
MLSRKAGIVFVLFMALFSGAITAGASQVPWSLNDVTILFPLPSPSETSSSAMIPPLDTAYRSKHLELGESLVAALGNTGM